jgi:pimeloyl-ACP methyl ester carboxylesterase
MTPIYLEHLGTGPTVLCLHGMPTPWDYLRPIARAAEASGRRALIAALPGYGPNAAGTPAATLEAVAEAIESAVARVTPERLALVGFSSGAYHALHLAVRGRIAVETVVLLGSYGDLSPEERDGLRGFATALDDGVSLGGVPSARFLSPGFAKSHPVVCASVERWIDAVSPAKLALELRALADSPALLERVPRFGGTLLARTGALDLATPPSHAEKVVKQARHGELQVVTSCGHALLEEDLEATTAATLAALPPV